MARTGRLHATQPTNPFGLALAELLKEKKQEDLAAFLGVSQPLVSAWLAGTKLPGVHLLEKLADLGIPQELYYESLKLRNISKIGYKKSSKALTV